jgi:hypothetical protein
MDGEVFCVTTAVARGRELLREQGIDLPYMQCSNAVESRQGAIRLLQMAKALGLTQQQALEYGFMAPSSKPVVLNALITTWNVGKHNAVRKLKRRNGK